MVVRDDICGKTASKIRFMRATTGYTCWDHKRQNEGTSDTVHCICWQIPVSMGKPSKTNESTQNSKENVSI